MEYPLLSPVRKQVTVGLLSLLVSGTSAPAPPASGRQRPSGVPSAAGASQIPQGRALTEETVDGYCEAVGWALGVRLTAGQKARLRQYLAEYYARNDSKRLTEVRIALETRAELQR